MTTDANGLVADVYDRMPLTLAPADYVRWLGDEPDLRDLMRLFVDPDVAAVDAPEQVWSWRTSPPRPTEMKLVPKPT
jgi:putative SOS response-associated peptidase YedK